MSFNQQHRRNRLTTSLSIAVPLDPNRTWSLKLASIPERTLFSKTPSQFHSPGCFGPDIFVGLSGCNCFVVSLLLRLTLFRYVRHACHAPGFPAASSGISSKTFSSSNVDLTYCSRSLIGIEPLVVGPSSPESVVLPALLPLKFLFSLRPNQSGNPCLRLKPPGGSLSSSVALTGSCSPRRAGE